eukprot:1160886-Pelagomonas_calceolata.AAC.3
MVSEDCCEVGTVVHLAGLCNMVSEDCYEVGWDGCAPGWPWGYGSRAHRRPANDTAGACFEAQMYDLNR